MLKYIDQWDKSSWCVLSFTIYAKLYLYHKINPDYIISVWTYKNRHKLFCWSCRHLKTENQQLFCPFAPTSWILITQHLAGLMSIGNMTPDIAPIHDVLKL